MLRLTLRDGIKKAMVMLGNPAYFTCRKFFSFLTFLWMRNLLIFVLQIPAERSVDDIFADVCAALDKL
jgi:hypothetical protein